MLSFTPPHNRRKKLDPGSLRKLHDLICHLIYRLCINLLAALWTMGNSDPGIQQTIIIINLCHRTHRRPRIPVCGLLIDGNRRWKPLNRINIRLLHLPQKLPRIAGQAFHITPLSLGINGIERQRAFARPGQPRKHNELVARDGQADIAQVMLSCAANDDLVVHRCNPPWLRNTV